MSTRSIVTSQPDIACGLCERRLLRGEQPDVFIVAGQRRIVCELCAPRAAQEGWMRESEDQQLQLPPTRPRRGRSFLDRLRQVGRPASEPDAPGFAREPAEAQPFDFMGAAIEAPPATAEPVAASPRTRITGPRVGAGDAAAGEAPVGAAAGGAAEPAPAAGESYLSHAVEAFNASEFPRRVAGVARSLGAPEVSVRSAEHLDSVVRIVVAWELCWYRYEVDLSDGPGEARLIGQGSELSELERDDRLANALAGDSGALALAGV
jgi:hypothetical protein